MIFKYIVAWTQVKESLELAYLNSGVHANRSFGMSQVLISGPHVKTSLTAQFGHAVYFVEYLTRY